MDLLITQEFPSEDLLRIVRNDPNSTQVELELARRLANVLDLLHQESIVMEEYRAKISRGLSKTAQVLTSC